MAIVDARPIIESGGQPFDQILAVMANLAPGEELVVLAPFDPIPLEGVLSSQGFGYETRTLSDGSWQVTFREER